jgi:hypothetical protein
MPVSSLNPDFFGAILVISSAVINHHSDYFYFSFEFRISRRAMESQARGEFKHFIHHGVFMILRLATANENREGTTEVVPSRIFIGDTEDKKMHG